LRTPSRHVTWLAVVAVCTIAIACSREEPPRPRETRSSSRPTASSSACPEFSDPRRVGTIADAGIEEISGVVASHRHDVLWVHEDSGADPIIYAVGLDGSDVRPTVVDGADHFDWEDIALADGNLWIGDIGDNARIRGGIQVYWFPEPQPGTTSVDANVLRLTYEDGPHDAEALLVDADNEFVFVITKELSLSEGTLFRAPIDGLSGDDVRELTEVGTVPLGIVTAADVSPLGPIVKNYGKGRLFPWTDDGTVESAIAGDACPVPIGGGESVTYRLADDAIYAIPEGASAPVWVSS
jgi:hypothetical protein